MTGFVAIDIMQDSASIGVEDQRCVTVIPSARARQEHAKYNRNCQRIRQRSSKHDAFSL
jgi:hypothetical protein